MSGLTVETMDSPEAQRTLLFLREVHHCALRNGLPTDILGISIYVFIRAGLAPDLLLDLVEAGLVALRESRCWITAMGERYCAGHFVQRIYPWPK